MNHKSVFYTQCNKAQNKDIDGKLTTEVKNCLAGITTDTRFYCKQCNKGYMLTNDGYCDPLIINKCTEYSMINSFNNQTFYPYETEPYEFLMEFKPSGCLKCESGFIATFKQKYLQQKFCIENEYLKTNYVASSDKFVEKCLINYF